MRVTVSATLAALVAIPAAGWGAEPVSSPPPTPDRAWTLSVGTGAGGFTEFVDGMSGTGVSGYDDTRSVDRRQLNLRIDRAQGRRFRFGAAYVYDGWTDRLFLAGTRVGAVDNSVHTLLVDATFRWIRSEHLELYSAVAAGAGLWAQSGSGIASSLDRVTGGFAFQLRYFGIAAGSERVRAFVDLGVGFEGLIVGGLLVRM